jgi:hypothetical protein
MGCGFVGVNGALCSTKTQRARNLRMTASVRPTDGEEKRVAEGEGSGGEEEVKRG